MALTTFVGFVYACVSFIAVFIGRDFATELMQFTVYALKFVVVSVISSIFVTFIAPIVGPLPLSFKEASPNGIVDYLSLILAWIVYLSAYSTGIYISDEVHYSQTLSLEYIALDLVAIILESSLFAASVTLTFIWICIRRSQIVFWLMLFLVSLESCVRVVGMSVASQIVGVILTPFEVFFPAAFVVVLRWSSIALTVGVIQKFFDRTSGRCQRNCDNSNAIVQEYPVNNPDSEN
jgi:hypothetical protein